MKKHIKSIVIITLCLLVGCALGVYLNDFNERQQSIQVHDYLHMPVNAYWFLAIPIFCLMITLIIVGYLFSRKIGDKRI